MANRRRNLNNQAAQEEALLRPPPLLEVLDLPTLLDKHFDAPEWVIPDLLPVGLTLLAAPPKTGKSRMVLALILRKAGFLPDGQRGGGLYLSLDDPSERRLQTRIRDLLDGRPLEGGVWFATSAATLDKGLCSQIDTWLKDHPGVRVVAVDALFTIKAKRRDDDVVSADYHGLKGLQALALHNNIAVILVHHTRKAPDAEDPFNRISGTQGLAAVADALWLLERPRGSTKERLRVSSRDGPDMILTLPTEDPLEGQWVVPTEDQAKTIFLRDQVLAAVMEAGSVGINARTLATALNLALAQVQQAIRDLHQHNRVARLRYGQYAARQDNLLYDGPSPGTERPHNGAADNAARQDNLLWEGPSPDGSRAEGTCADDSADIYTKNIRESATSPVVERAEGHTTKIVLPGSETCQDAASPGGDRAGVSSPKIVLPGGDRYGCLRRYRRAISLMRRGFTKTQAIKRAGITHRGFREVNNERQEVAAVFRGGRVHHWRLVNGTARPIRVPGAVALPESSRRLAAGQSIIPVVPSSLNCHTEMPSDAGQHPQPDSGNGHRLDAVDALLLSVRGGQRAEN